MRNSPSKMKPIAVITTFAALAVTGITGQSFQPGRNVPNATATPAKLQPTKNVTEDNSCDIYNNFETCPEGQVCVEDEQRNRFCVDEAGESVLNPNLLGICRKIGCKIDSMFGCAEGYVCVQYLQSCTYGECVPAASPLCKGLYCGLACYDGLRMDADGCPYCRCVNSSDV